MEAGLSDLYEDRDLVLKLKALLDCIFLGNGIYLHGNIFLKLFFINYYSWLDFGHWMWLQ